MTDNNFAAAVEELEKGIAALAGYASRDDIAATTARDWAIAANQLAEARAWLRSPGQSHGGGGSAD